LALLRSSWKGWRWPLDRLRDFPGNRNQNCHFVHFTCLSRLSRRAGRGGGGGGGGSKHLLRLRYNLAAGFCQAAGGGGGITDRQQRNWHLGSACDARNPSQDVEALSGWEGSPTSAVRWHFSHNKACCSQLGLSGCLGAQPAHVAISCAMWDIEGWSTFVDRNLAIEPHRCTLRSFIPCSVLAPPPASRLQMLPKSALRRWQTYILQG